MVAIAKLYCLKVHGDMDAESDAIHSSFHFSFRRILYIVLDLILEEAVPNSDLLTLAL